MPKINSRPSQGATQMSRETPHDQAGPILDLFRLVDRVAVVTGASGGLGAGFARALGEAGASVVLAARRADQLAELSQELSAAGVPNLAVPTDVIDPASARNLVEQTMERFGRLDVLINNAGVSSIAPATSEAPEDFRRVLEVNLNGAYFVAQACARVMPRGSAIVNVSSVLGLVKSVLPQAAYAASKAGLIGLTRDLSAQWSGRKGIRVNAIAPGFVMTDMVNEMSSDILDRFLATSSLGRVATQREIDAAMLFLAAPASSYITGITLAVDGGMSGH
jgi:NAD(P)-dependent dehydrogenase (short-subunit alcohol dehydrogenase family)